MCKTLMRGSIFCEGLSTGHYFAWPVRVGVMFSRPKLLGSWQVELLGRVYAFYSGWSDAVGVVILRKSPSKK